MEYPMKKSKFLSLILLLSFIASPLFSGTQKAEAQPAQPISVNLSQQAQSPAPNDEIGSSNTTGQMRTTTMAMRIAAALHLNLARSGSTATYAGINPDTSKYSPLANVGGELGQMVTNLANPDYFGSPNWANSALPKVDAAGNVTGGIHKFTEALPTFCPLGSNGLGQCIPVASPDTATFAGSDYYEIAVVEYREQMSPDLYPSPTSLGTKLRGYVQVVPFGTAGGVPLFYLSGAPIMDKNGNQVLGATKPQYLGPMILAQGCSEVANPNPANCTPKPVRVKFDNYLPTGPAGDLFLPTDTTYMGAGMGPGGSILSVSVSNGGTGYTASTTVTIAPPPCVPGPSCLQATATATVINGSVTAVSVTVGGSGYTSAPTVSFAGGGANAAATAVLAGLPGDMYSQNRATLHLHGGNTPWISDGTTHQWTTPNGESTFTSYLKGDSVAYVPDMWFDANGNLITTPNCQGFTTCSDPNAKNDPGIGSLTFFWTNQESGRLLFYHDHAYGITRLNVYAGEAAGYLIVDPTEDAMLKLAGVPGTISNPGNPLDPVNDLTHLYPLVIQDKTFVPDSGVAGGQLALTDPTWVTSTYGTTGDLWFPHVYMPNQNPADVSGANAFGRWDYGPWFWPPQDPSTFVPSGQPYPCISAGTPVGGWAFPPLMCPGTPNPSGTPEGFLDTPVVNGTLYPKLTVDPTAYRFQMLMAGNDRTWNLQLYVADPLTIAVTKGGSGYTAAPAVSFLGGAGGGAGVAATAVMSNGTITSILLTNVGKGYTSAPLVSIAAPGCTLAPVTCVQATATASFDLITGTITGIHITNGGAGYTVVPAVTIDPPASCTVGCVTALADAYVTAPGVVLGITVTNPGSAPWTAAPTVVIAAPTGVCTPGPCQPAAAIASVNSEVKMVPATPHDATSTVPLCGQANPTSGAMLVTAITDASGNPVNGTGLPLGCWPVQWPTDGRDGGVPDPLTAGPAMVQIGTESGLLPAPVVIPSTPVGYEYNRRSITVLNIFTHGLLLGPAERADVLVDFSQFAGKTLILYNDAPAPVPAFDSRSDYYTGDPDQTMAGGAPSTLPGYGPNTRTIMQITVNAIPVGSVAPLNMASVGAGVTAQFVARQNQMIIPEPQLAVGNGYSATPTYSRISDTSFTGFFNGQVGSLTLTSGGSGYASAPTVSITGGGGSGAAAAVTFVGANVNSLTLNNGGSGYTSAPSVAITGGGGSGATASATIRSVVKTVAVTNGGSGYSSPPAVSFRGGGGTGATAVATIAGGRVTAVTVTNGGSGYQSAPRVIFTGGGGLDATATSTISGIVFSLLLTNGGTGYTSNPTVGFTGGGGSGAGATATFLPGKVASLVLTNPGTGYTSIPTISFSPVIASPAVAVANAPIIPFGPKAIQELFTLDYGRMNATLGVELPFTNFFVQTTIPYGYIDPPTEMFKTGDTIIWKITHNGVDTHFIHFHLYDVQVINRVGWDGMIKPPDVNEVGWKDTVRMNPLEDIIVAMRPMKQSLPWKIPNSIRPMDVTQPIGANNPNNTAGFANIDPTNEPAPVNNDVINFGWEYVVHCHILGHEENDMMRPQLLAVPPDPVTSVIATRQGAGNNQRVLITWIDGSMNETGFTVQRATNLSGPWSSLTPAAPAAPGINTAMSFTDTSVARRTTYYYRVVANNVVGYTKTYTAPVVGYPNLSADSVPVNAASPITTLAIDQSGPIFADSFETGLNMWSGVIGSANISTQAVISPNGGAYGMAATIGPNGEPAYVYDNSPAAEVMYDANFYFNPNKAVTDSPVDIFIGLDQNGQPLFGVQYQSVDANTFQLRTWAMIGADPVYSNWDEFATAPGSNLAAMTHKLDVAWASGASAGLSFYVDDHLYQTLSGDTSAFQLEEVVLGPSLGLDAGASGTMYFDEFTSSRLLGLTFISLLPSVSR
jgi:FtsP/CotA-like multicopper oxidase with cupredoxin domain